jgi:hypothetical protein
MEVKLFEKTALPINLKRIVAYKNNLVGIGLRNAYLLNPDLKSYKTIWNSKDRLTSLACDSASGKIYLGGLRGLYSIALKDNYTTVNKLLDCRIEDLIFHNGKLFIATYGEGVIIKSPDRSDTINERKGMKGDICRALTLSGGIIWISTNSGISRVTYNPDHTAEIKNYNLGDFTGAASASKVCILKDKAFCYAGNRLYSFQTQTRPGKSLFYLSWLTINNESCQLKSSLDLKSTQSNITIGFEALFYDCNDVISYRYRLGKNETWSYTNEPKVDLRHLSPGDYQFAVQAQNSQGNWIAANRMIAFKIQAPFWRKIWFIVLISLTLISLIALAIWLRYNRILKQELQKNALKMRMYELESKAVKAQMNPHFIFNALSSIQEFVLSDDNENAYKYLSKFSKLVRRLLESSTSASISLEVEIDILKRYIEIESLRFRNAFEYEINVSEDLSPPIIRIPHMLIQPFVENAIWHGLMHKTGEKKLSLSFSPLNEKCLICIIEDNGVGRQPKDKDAGDAGEKKSMAIEFIVQHLKLMGKMRNTSYGFEITDKRNSNNEAAGTIVRIEIPIIK